MQSPLMIRISLVALALSAPLAAGCDRGPSCREAAENMVAVANAGAPEGGEATKPEARERLQRTCEDRDWPAEVRRCLIDAPDQEAATACMRDLAPGPGGGP